MTDRTVAVHYRAYINQYVRALSQMGAGTRAVSRDISTAIRTNHQDFQQLSLVTGIAATGIAAGLTKTIGVAAGFEKQMDAVGAAVGGSARDMKLLEAAALEAARNQDLAGVTAVSAAQAEEALAKAGLEAADIYGGALNSALLLSIAGELDQARAAEIATDAMTIFNIKGNESARVADVIAAGGGKASGSVGQMAEAFQQSALVAGQLDLTLEDTTGTLALFASSGLKGSDAGTSFRTMLMRLNPQSKEAADLMKALGIDFFDAQGRFIGIEAAAGQLQTRMSGLTQEQRSQAMATIFGQDAIRAATILFENGAAGVAEWVEKVNDSGYASDLAGEKMDNLAGDIEALLGAIEAGLISSGSEATGVLRFLAQAATGAVNELSELPGPVQAGAVGLATLSAGALGVLSIAGTLIPRIDQARQAIAAFGATVDASGNQVAGWGAKVNAGLGRAGRFGGYAAGALIAVEGVSLLVSKLQEISNGKPDIDAVTAALLELAGAADQVGASTAFAAVDEAARGTQATLAEIISDWEQFARTKGFDDDVVSPGLVKALEDVDTALAGIVDSGRPDLAREALVRFAQQSGVAVEDLLPALDGYSDALLRGENAATLADGGAKDMTDTLVEQGSAVDDLTDKLDDYSDSLDALFEKSFGVQDATDQLTANVLDWAAAVRDAKAEGNEFATSLDATSSEGLRNREVLQGLVRDALDVADQLVRAGMDPLPAMEALHASLLDTATQLGFDRDMAAAYIDVLLQIPTAVNTLATFDAAAAFDELEAYLNRLARVPTSIVTQVEVAEVHRFQNQLGISPSPAASSGAVGFGVADAIRRGAGNVSSGRSNPSSSGGGQSGRDAADEAERDRRAWLSAQDEFHRNLYDHDMESLADNLAYWDARLAQERQGSAAWFAILDERDRVLDQHAADVDAWNEAVARNQEEAVDLWMTTAQRQYEIGELSRDQFRRILQDRLEDLEEHGQRLSDEWWQTWQDIAAIDDQAARELERANDERRKAQEEALDKLNRLLDQEAQLRRRREELAASHGDRMRSLEEQHAAEQQRVLDERRRALFDWADVGERVVVGWGNSARALSRNLDEQLAVFDEWADTLQEVRRRGLSEAVIDMLGLDEGPQALGQLRMFSTATQAEIDDLNRKVEQRAARAGEQLAIEQDDSLSTVGSMLRELAAEHQRQVDELTADFLAAQSELDEELRNLGFEHGRSWADAIAAGIKSGSPALLAAVRAAIAAMAQQTPGDGIRSDNPLTKPILGPKILGSYAAGTDFVPATGLYRLHRGEAVVPSDLNRTMSGGQIVLRPVVSPIVNFAVNVYDANGHLVSDDSLRVVVTETNRSTAGRRFVQGSK